MVMIIMIIIIILRIIKKINILVKIKIEIFSINYKNNKK